METLIVNYRATEKRYAFLKEKKVQKIYIEQPTQQSLVGNIYFGTVSKVLPGMNAVFVDIGEEKHGYLHRDKLVSYVLDESEKGTKDKVSVSSFVRQGERIIVQVEKDETGNKGVRLTGIVEFAGEHLVYMPHGRYVAVSKKIQPEQKNAHWRQFGQELKEEQEGLLFRTSCETQTFAQMEEQLTELRLQHQKVVKDAQAMKKAGILLKRDSFQEELLNVIGKMTAGEIIVDDLKLKQSLERRIDPLHQNITFSIYNYKENIFNAYRIQSEIENALKRIVWLDSGAYLVIDETEALTIIDVNTGKFSGKTNLDDTVKKTNTLALVEALRQIRLRDIGGIILIDFIDMRFERDRDELLQRATIELKKDEKQTKVIGFTPLGILQITRKKTKPSLLEAMTEKCPTCEGTGRIQSAESIAFKLEREIWEHQYSDYESILIETTAEVKKLLEGDDGSHLKRLEDAVGLSIQLHVVPFVKHSYVIKKFL